jgi:hypothetical protein
MLLVKLHLVTYTLLVVEEVDMDTLLDGALLTVALGG